MSSVRTTSLSCPNCGTGLEPGRPVCAACGIRLSGHQAARLWQVDQQIEVLTRERQQLITELLQPAPSFETAYEPIVDRPQRPGRPSPTGQQLLLGLGALLLLSAATFAGIVVWMVVGVWGQAFLLVAMTALSAVGAHAAARRGLPAAAETGAVLASGLSAIGAWAAWSLDLAGLRDVSGTLYAAVAALVIGVLLLGLDRSAPRTQRSGEPTPAIRTYQPVAALALSLVAWLLLAESDLEGVWFVLGLAGVTLVSLALWVAGRRLGLSEAAARVPVGSAVLGALGFLSAGTATAHDLHDPHHGWSALLMLLTAGAIAWAATRSTQWGLDAGLRPILPAAAAALAVVAGWSFTWEAHWALLFVAAVVFAALLVGLVWAPLPEGASDTSAHRSAQVAFGMVGAGLVAVLTLLSLQDQPQLVDPSIGDGPSRVLVTGVAGVWTLVSVAVAVRLGSLVWLLLAHLWLAATLVIGLLDAEDGVWTVTWLVATAVLAGVAAALVLSGVSARAGLRGWDRVVLAFAAAFAIVPLLASLGLDHPWTGATFVAVGLIAYAVSLLPHRLLVAYAAALVISTGTAMLLSAEGWDVVESWSWPLALLLASIGWRHWRQDRDVSSRVSMGPALGAAFVPSLLVAVGEGDDLRLALISVAAIAVLVWGLARRLQAPVVVAGASLAVIAVTQGGPYLEILPRWVSLGLAGLVLLTIGVSWERAVVAGRRGSAWFGQLR